MKKFSDYLDEFKEKHGLPSDNKLAEHLGVSRQYICNAKRIGVFSDEQCLEIARGIGVPEYEVIISRNMLKETGPMQEVWAKAAKRLGGILAIGAIMTYGSGMTAVRLNKDALTDLNYRKDLTETATDNLYYRKLRNLTKRALHVFSQCYQVLAGYLPRFARFSSLSPQV